MTRQGIRPWRDWLPGVSDPGEIDSPGYQTLGRLTFRGIRPWRDWLPGVSDPGEIDSPGYQTLERLTPRGIRPWRDWLPGVSDPVEIDSPGNQTLGSHVFWEFLCASRGLIPPGEFEIYTWNSINLQILNQNRKYFNPIGQVPRWVRFLKKLKVKNHVGLSL